MSSPNIRKKFKKVHLSNEKVSTGRSVSFIYGSPLNGVHNLQALVESVLFSSWGPKADVDTSYPSMVAAETNLNFSNCGFRSSSKLLSKIARRDSVTFSLEPEQKTNDNVKANARSSDGF
ncbi:unnamed protein product [Lepeophtheirus salmonis]|uniref:(salmon louse) hypothetical protein n=1 Tax=Lepeophtheirus salmonis TaxID=72036 RepID=A0A7R8CN09_LEPSM|nr:unnamed protein product [Lepeophtheirus salmonis]CAF2871061.1 unnamed protein product [Lepeophtheirus salmonis]